MMKTLKTLLLQLLLTMAPSDAAVRHSVNSPISGKEVAVSCDTEFELNHVDKKDVEFSTLLGATKECKYLISAPKGSHLDLACKGNKGEVRANGKAAMSLFKTKDSSIELVFYPVNASDQMFCRAEIQDEHEELSALKGANGEDTNIEEFKLAFNVEFKSVEDEKRHIKVLVERKKRIREINADRSISWTAGLTSVSHLSEEELSNTMTGDMGEDDVDEEERRRRNEEAERELLEPLRQLRETLPTSVDLTKTGAVTPARSQGRCGSCAAFATVATVETCVQKETGVLPLDLSEQNVLDCGNGKGGKGCGGGNAYLYLQLVRWDLGGMVANEVSYPYTKKTSTYCKKVSSAQVGAKVSKVFSKDGCNEEDIMRLLAEGRAVTARLKTNTAFSIYRGGVLDSNYCCDWRTSNGSIDYKKCPKQSHAVAIVGYGEEYGKKYWKIKNSWGDDWGENGFGKIKRGTGHCGIGLGYTVPICKSDGSIPPPVKPSNSACGGILTASRGVIASPNYPRNYDNNKECVWKIQPTAAASSSSKVIKFTISYLDIEYEGKSCGYDYLKFYNSDKKAMSFGSSAAERSGRVCGSTRPEPIIGQSSGAYLKFKSDDRQSKKGFVLTYQLIDMPYCKGQKLSTASDVQPVSFSTINFPSSYESNAKCDWTITVPYGQKIRLEFNDFETEYYYDYVNVYEPVSSTSKSYRKLATLSGNSKPDAIVSSKNKILVLFRSNSNVNKKGFKATASAQY